MSSIQDAVACDPSRFIGAEVTAIESFESRVEFLTSRGRLVAKRAGRLQRLGRAALEPVVWHPHGALAYRGVAAPPEGTWGALVAIQRATHGSDTWLITITCRVVGAFLTTRPEHLFCVFAPEGWQFESMGDTPAANVGVAPTADDYRAARDRWAEEVAAIASLKDERNGLRTANHHILGARASLATVLGCSPDDNLTAVASALRKDLVEATRERDNLRLTSDDLKAERDEARATIREMVKALGWPASSDPIEAAKTTGRQLDEARQGISNVTERFSAFSTDLANILVVPFGRTTTDVAKERMAEYRTRGNSLEAIARHIGGHTGGVTLPDAVRQIVDRLRAVACELGCAASGDLVEAIRIRRQVAAGHERDAFFLRICQAVGHTGTVSADILGEKVERLVSDLATERATAARFERQIDAMRVAVGCGDDDNFDHAVTLLRAGADDAKAMLSRVREERDAKQAALDEAVRDLKNVSGAVSASNDDRILLGGYDETDGVAGQVVARLRQLHRDRSQWKVETGSLRAQVSQMRDDAQTRLQRITVLETQNHEIAKARNDAQREAARLKAQLEATASAPAADAAPAPRRIVDGDAFVDIMKAAESPILAIGLGHDDRRWFATVRCHSGILTIRAKPQVRLERRGGYRAAGDGWVFTGTNCVCGNVLTIGTSTGFAEIFVDDRRDADATGDAVELAWASA